MNDKTWLIIYMIIGWATSIVAEIQCQSWKRKHGEAITAWTIESNHKDKQILKLQEELENLKAKPVKHGHWIPKRGDWWLCSNCENNLIYSTSDRDRTEKQRYCSRCGARMDGDVE